MSKKHERNLGYLARAEAYARIASEALQQAGVSLSRLEIGPSLALAQSAYENANHRMRDLDVELSKLKKLVCP